MTDREMTTSPRLPGGVVRPAAAPGNGATAAELNHMSELARRRDARTIAIGRGRSALAAAAVAALARRWEGEGRIVLDIVSWPEEAASWLRQATRFAAADPDLWVMAGPAGGWAQMTRRLLWSTPWQPGRTIALADVGTPKAIWLAWPAPPRTGAPGPFATDSSRSPGRGRGPYPGRPAFQAR
jgi:hypothetical protein